jgi:hypothetical protein
MRRASWKAGAVANNQVRTGIDEVDESVGLGVVLVPDGSQAGLSAQVPEDQVHLLDLRSGRERQVTWCAPLRADSGTACLLIGGADHV